jgi:D-alanyl-D-alanine carboxypeptidase
MKLFFSVLAAWFLAAAAPPSQAPLPAFIARHAKANDFSGTILVTRGGHTLYDRSFGLADRAFAVPAANSTRYLAASVAKLFTSVLILQLAEEGRLRLDQPIRSYLADYPGEGADRITIHHLLNHTSGIEQFDRVASLQQALEEGVPNYQKPQTGAALLKSCCSGKLARAPGAAFDYNNADYIVLGRIIERVTGKSYEQALVERIVRPLGLRDTGFTRQSEIVERLAPTYFWRDDVKLLINDLPVYFENWYAAGALYSSARDLAAFADALYGGRLLKPASLAAMLKPGLDDYGYGLWSYSFKRGGKTYRVAKRPGSIMGANAVLYRLLDDGTTIVILANTNKTDLDVFAQRIADILVTGVAQRN